MNVTVIDYGIGNLHSVVKALVREGGDVTVTSRADDVLRAERLVLPGVGAFADGMRGLEERALVEPLVEYARTGRPLVGICLGMQLFMSESFEFGHHRGLGLVEGPVVEIPRSPGVKVPQIGWNRVQPGPRAEWRGTLLDGIAPGEMMYFVHSFTAQPRDERHRLADADYGGFVISAAIQRDNVVGFQFHPEKSGAVGLGVLRRFLS